MDSQYFDTLRRIAQPIRASALPHTLDPMHRLLDALGNPQQHFRSIVVTGSTGKGTTCARLADLLSITQMKVGLYTSPHLHSFRERIVIIENHTDSVTPHRISQADFVTAAQQVFAAQQTLDHAYSTFETTTALAFVWFAQQHIDVAVLEVGIGGRFDAVNTVANSLAVFTPIEAEHIAMLGGSLESVAWHKAGIIQPDGIAVSVYQSPEVQLVLEREAAAQNATLMFNNYLVDFIAEKRFFSLFSTQPTLTADLHTFSTAFPARLERLTIANRAAIIDGGHTPAAARHLHPAIPGTKSIRFIIGMFRDKNVAAYLSTFDLPQFHFVYTQAPGDRALTPDELLTRYTPTQAAVTLVPTPDEAFAQIETAPEQLIVVAGSFRMAAAARETFGLLSPEDLEESRLTRAIFEGDAYQSKLT